MDRRAALSALAAAALCAIGPIGAQPRRGLKTIGYLSGGAGAESLVPLLARHGHVEGRDVRFVVRQVPRGAQAPPVELASELVAAGVDVLLVFSSERTRLLYSLTRSIPIVTGGVGDPMAYGMARTLARPGGNVTGLSYETTAAAGVQLGLLRAILPRLARVRIVLSPWASREDAARETVETARSMGIASEIVSVRSLDGLDAEFASVADRRVEARLVGMMPPSFPVAEIGAIAKRRKVVAMWWDDEVVRQGGLFHYTRYHADHMARTVAILDKVLRGIPPGEIPFEGPDQTRCVVNRGAAAAIPVDLPDELMLRATEVIAT